MLEHFGLIGDVLGTKIHILWMRLMRIWHLGVFWSSKGFTRFEYNQPCYASRMQKWNVAKVSVHRTRKVEIRWVAHHCHFESYCVIQSRHVWVEFDGETMLMYSAQWRINVCLALICPTSKCAIYSLDQKCIENWNGAENSHNVSWLVIRAYRNIKYKS